jgi:hypothetical protein
MRVRGALRSDGRSFKRADWDDELRLIAFERSNGAA